MVATLPEVVYAWARDAPRLVLPEGVGFRVGGRSSIQYLVLQVHYASVEHFSRESTQGLDLLESGSKCYTKRTIKLLGK